MITIITTNTIKVIFLSLLDKLSVCVNIPNFSKIQTTTCKFNFLFYFYFFQFDGPSTIQIIFRLPERRVSETPPITTEPLKSILVSPTSTI